jgi:4-hydroxybenzoate polyprenyltransferase
VLDKIKAYSALIRFDKPIGTMLLFWPCLFGTIVASEKVEYILILKFFLGAFFMRSAGCIINDIWDRDFDKNVERTKNRPLASGIVTVREAIILVVVFMLFGLLILLTFSLNSILFSMASIPLVLIYPLMKRVTYFPQLILGFVFNYGVLVAGMELQGYLSDEIILLYAACIFWTLAYDTVYGFMDIKDDKKIGVKSLSIFIENRNPKIWLACFYALFFVFIYFVKWEMNLLGYLIYLSAVIFSIFEMLKLNLNSTYSCMRFFKNTNIFGILIFLVSYL